MADLNVLEMLRGKAPDYAPDSDIYGQRLAVVMSVSSDDIGRDYGGGMADMPGKVVDPELVAADVTAALGEALDWLHTNDEDLPEDFDARVDGTLAGEDSLTVTISCGPEDALEQTEITIGQIND